MMKALKGLLMEMKGIKWLKQYAKTLSMPYAKALNNTMYMYITIFAAPPPCDTIGLPHPPAVGYMEGSSRPIHP